MALCPGGAGKSGLKFLSIALSVSINPINYWRFMQPKNVLAWFLLLGLLTAFLLWSLTRTVTEESLLVLRSLGIQVKKTFLFHNTVTRFMDMSEVTDVVINEGISLHQVVCYLSVLLSPIAETSPGGLFPLFLDTRPNLKELKEIYLTVQPFLSKKNIGS